MKPLFLSDLQKQIAELPKEQRQEIRILTWVNEKDEYRALPFELPETELLEKERDLYRRYLLSMMNNMLVSFGGAKLEIYRKKSQVLDEIIGEAVKEFNVESVRNDRKGYGVYLNYINRMNIFLGIGKFSIEVKDLEAWPDLSQHQEYRVYRPGEEKKELELLRRSATELEGTCICSLDIGGNSIKGAVVKDGKVFVLKEHRWYPTGCKTAAEMNSPMILMARFMSLCTGLLEKEGSLDKVADVMPETTTYEELLAATERLEAEGIVTEGRFDSIVAGFPDIIVYNKIAGGESFKHLGMKNNPEIDYEIEFFLTADLDQMLTPYGREGAAIIVINDGNAASYITSVEQAFASQNLIDENGMFACTVGTEMGTGFVSRGGTIQHIPMEGFQHIIDLGSEEYQKYPAFDIRSILSTNTGVSGVVQKYISQMALFRMVITELWETKDPLFQELLDKGLITFDEEKDAMHTVVEPKDLRGVLTRMLVGQLANEHPAVVKTYKMMGKAMGILIDQDRLIYPEITTTRLLSGGIIADNRAFYLMREGLKEYNAEYEVMRMDEDTMYSPLLKSMKPEERSFNVAIGSAYIGNRFLIEKK